jgi:hypothetical protein
MDQGRTQNEDVTLGEEAITLECWRGTEPQPASTHTSLGVSAFGESTFYLSPLDCAA